MIPLDLDLETEAALIDELNEVRPDWRDKYVSPAEAAENELPEWRTRYLPLEYWYSEDTEDDSGLDDIGDLLNDLERDQRPD